LRDLPIERSGTDCHASRRAELRRQLHDPSSSRVHRELDDDSGAVREAGMSMM
jgi:hypothetical protein